MANETSNLRQSALELAILGGVEIHEIHAVNDLSRLTSDCPITDFEGNPLVIGLKYQTPWGDIFRLTKYMFGSGNMLDTYYRVYGVSSKTLKDEFIFTINVKFVGGIHNPTYPSQLNPIHE
jgi:hypothetical protein